MQNKAKLHSAGAADPAISDPATLTIRQVSALLDVPAPTIRSWERRHALTSAARDEHGYRRYTAEDVKVLGRVRDARARGVSPSEAVSNATTPPPPELCRQILSATQALDAEAVSGTLDSSVTAHGLAATIEEVLLPSMREVGAQWSRSECDVAQEHCTTSVVLGWLARRAGEAPTPLFERPVVLCCGPQDQHTIGLEAFTVLLRHQRVDCRSLGAQTPAAALRVAVDRCSAAAVVVVSHLARNRSAAVSALRAVDDCGTAIFYAGDAFRTAASRRGLPGHYLGASLTHAADHIATRLWPT